MADKIKHTVFFGAMGILVAVLIIAGIVVGGVHFPSLRLPSIISNKGRLVIEIMDKPVELKHLNITIDSLSIKRVENETEEWLTLELLGGEPIYFDLLALQNVTLTLSDTEIPAGNYTMIKMHVLTANATYPDGQTVELAKVPSEHIKVLLKPHDDRPLELGLKSLRIVGSPLRQPHHSTTSARTSKPAECCPSKRSQPRRCSWCVHSATEYSLCQPFNV